MKGVSVLVLAPLLELLRLLLLPLRGFWHLFEVYGFAEGALLFCFSSTSIWRLEAQVLGSLENDDAFTFKKSVQDECSMISIAAAIVAQIAITALSLPALSQTHWIARGFLMFSLTSSLLAVFYSTTQYKTLGRLIRPRQIRQWIRGGTGSLAPLGAPLRIARNIHNSRFWESNPSMSNRHSNPETQPPMDISRDGFIFDLTYSPRNDFPPCDPADIDPADLRGRLIQGELSKRCFRPSISSVITISAPQFLLSTSIGTLLVSLGVYLGFTWTRNLDNEAGENDSRNVFIMYVVGLFVCAVIYSISGSIKEGEEDGELLIIAANIKTWALNNRELVHTWGYDLVIDESGSLRFKHRPASAG